MRKNYISLVLCIAIFGGITSCKNSLNSKLEKEYSKTFADIIETDQGVFRGWVIDTTISSVINFENKKLSPLSEENGKVSFQKNIGDKDIMDINYLFVDNKLDGINTDFSIENTEKAVGLINNFKKFYTSKFGESGLNQGYLVWKQNKALADYSVLVELSSEDEFREYRKFHLNIYKQNGYKITTDTIKPILN